MEHKPIQVVSITDEHSFVLNIDALESILLKRSVRDKKVVVVSVAGAFRKGKSFLLDFFLRYLNAHGSPDWLGDESAPLRGFPWRGGAERQTTGIMMWDKAFHVRLPGGGEPVVVLLMDTQGAFDSQSTVRDCATVFALSTMLSSVQVYNIVNNVQEDDLQHLHLFTEYGRLAMEGSKSSRPPFQALHFLVRDWSYPYEYAYGNAGGDKLLEKRLLIDRGQHQELQSLRRHIRSCFSKIACFLLPHPGLKVATNPQFDGKLQDIEPDFREQLGKLVHGILAPDQLVVKEINGSQITAKELVEYFKAYIKIYQGDELPEPKSMLQATAEANNLAAMASAKELYEREMEKVCGGHKPYLNHDRLEQEHMRCFEAAIGQFASTKKMGGEELSKSFGEKLECQLEELHQQLKKHNASKNLMAIIMRPALLFCSIIMCFLLSRCFGIVGLETLANLMNFATGIFIALLIKLIFSYHMVGNVFFIAHNL